MGKILYLCYLDHPVQGPTHKFSSKPCCNILCSFSCNCTNLNQLDHCPCKNLLVLKLTSDVDSL